MLTKPVPPWITLGGVTLAATAGCINVVGILSAQHFAIAHMSGTVSNLGLNTIKRDFAVARHAALIIVFFFLGCVLSGMIIRHSALRAGRRYGVALMCESGLLVGATSFLRHDAIHGLYLGTMACGLQNAMATSYSGAVIRTTHMTGIVTDLGIAIGLTARGERADWRRMRLYLALLAGFLGGSAAGTFGYLHFGADVLLFPAFLAGTIGAGYTAWKQHRRRFNRAAPAPAAAPPAVPAPAAVRDRS